MSQVPRLGEAENGSRAPAHEPAPPEVHLHPGQALVTSEGITLSTILGSCVAVCLWDDRRRAGGMNHYLLPHAVSDRAPRSSRFGSVAVPDLVRAMRERGSVVADLRAKVFGGSCVLSAFRGRDGEALGLKNVEIALTVLASHGIAVVEMDVGGTRGRKVVFRTSDGTTRSRPI